MKKIGLYLLFIMGLASLSCSVAAYDFDTVVSSVETEGDEYGVDVDDYISEDGEVDVDGIQNAYKEVDDALAIAEEGRDNPFKIDGDTTSYVNASGSLYAGGYKSKVSQYVSSAYGTTSSNIWSYSPIGSLTGTVAYGTTTNDTSKKEEYGEVTTTGSSATSYTGTSGSAAVTASGTSGSSYSGSTTSSYSTGRTYLYTSGSSMSIPTTYNSPSYWAYVAVVTGTDSSGNALTVYSGAVDHTSNDSGAYYGAFFWMQSVAGTTDYATSQYSSLGTSLTTAVNRSTSNYYTGYSSHSSSSATASVYNITSVSFASQAYTDDGCNNNAKMYNGGYISGGGYSTTSSRAEKTMYVATVTGALASGTSDVIYSGSRTSNGTTNDTIRGVWYTSSTVAASASSTIATALNRHPDNYWTGYTSTTTTTTATIYSSTSSSYSSASINYITTSQYFGAASISGGKTTTTTTMYTAALTNCNETANSTTNGTTTIYSGYVTDTSAYVNDSLGGKWFTSSSIASAAATAIRTAVNASPQNYFKGYKSMTSSTLTTVYYVGTASSGSRANNYATTSNYFGGLTANQPGTYKYSTYRTSTYTQSSLATTNLTSYANARDYSFGGTGDNQHSAVINASGTVYTAGYNSQGQLGAGTTTNSTSTTPTGYVARTLPGSVKGVRVETGTTSTVVLGEDGKLYATGTNIGRASATSFTQLTVTGASATAEIVDFKVGSNALFVLYSNGEIFKGTTSFTKISGTVEYAMIDIETTSATLFAVSTSNQVYTGSGTTLSVMSSVTPASDILQIRGGASQWGYLTDTGIFYRATSLTGTPAQLATSVKYFDMGATNYAYLKTDGTVTGSGITGTITNPDDFNDDYHSNSGLTRNTPPTITKFSQSDSTTGNELTPVYGQTIELEFTEYLVFDYTWFVQEKFDDNKQQRITNVISGAGFTGGEWITDGTPKPQHTIFPKNVGTYSYVAQLQEYKNNQWEDVGQTYELTFKIVKTTAEFSLNETALTALVSDYVMENNGRNTYQLIMNQITASTYTNFLTTAPTVYQVTNGSYVEKDVTAFATFWEVYIEKENGTKVTNDATMGTSGTFNIVFKFNAAEVTNYTTDTIEKFEFNIEEKEFGLTNSNIELNENKEKYSQSSSTNTNGSSIEFAFTHYINITNNMYRDSVEHTIGDTITKIVITNASGFSYTIANYDTADLDAVWSYLPKAVGAYTATASFIVNGHIFEETISLTYNITKAQPELEITDNLIDNLESTVLNSGVNSVPNMITSVINGIKASGTGSTNPFVVFTPTMNTLVGTTLTEIDFTNDIYWNVVFTRTNTVGAEQVTNITNQPGTYYVWVSFDVSKVDPTFTNYHPVAAVVAEFTIAGRINELTETEFGIVANTVTGHYVSDADYLDSIEFGNTYLFNISNELYNTAQDTISAVVKLKGSNTILANIFYNSLENNAENANGSLVANTLPKAVGTYVIYVSITNSDGHEYGTVEKEYSITKATPTVTINSAMETYLENIKINNNGVISTYKLINQVTNEIEEGIDESGFVSVSRLFSTSGSDLTEITTISKNSWTVYFTHGGNSAGERLTDLVPNTTYYVWVVFDSNDGNYETSEAVGHISGFIF